MRACCWAIAEFHFNWIGQEGENSVLWKSCQKLLLFVTHELIKVQRCFICQKNSRYVWITWLKGHFIVTTHEDARAWQSWGRNLRTPCRLSSLSEPNWTELLPDVEDSAFHLNFEAESLSALASPLGSIIVVEAKPQRNSITWAGGSKLLRLLSVYRQLRLSEAFNIDFEYFTTILGYSNW